MMQDFKKLVMMQRARRPLKALKLGVWAGERCRSYSSDGPVTTVNHEWWIAISGPVRQTTHTHTVFFFKMF